jgi:hypothetical protein
MRSKATQDSGIFGSAFLLNRLIYNSSGALLVLYPGSKYILKSAHRSLDKA